MTTNSGKDVKQQELFFITESFSLSWDPGRASKMIDKSLQCSTIFIASEGDLTLGPKTVLVTRASCSINFVKVIMAEKNFLHRYQKGVERLSALLVLSRKFYTFLPAAENRKKYLKAVKILPRPFPITYISARLARRKGQPRAQGCGPRPSPVTHVLTSKKVCPWTRLTAAYKAYVSKVKECERERCSPLPKRGLRPGYLINVPTLTLITSGTLMWYNFGRYFAGFLQS